MDATRRAWWLSVVTVAYNVVEAAVAVAAGLIAGSPALLGFAVDSGVESASGSAMLWRFGPRADVEGREADRVESRARKLVGVAFLLLAVYVVADAGLRLIQRRPPEPSLVGIALAAVSLVAMPLLYVAKARTSDELDSPSLAADARQTLTCMMLSAALLVGLVGNLVYGLWHLDPIAGLGIAAYAAREGVEELGSSSERT